MVIVEVKTVKRDEYVVFMTMSIGYERDIANWLDKKISKGQIKIDENGIDVDDLHEICFKKFGEAPIVIESRFIPTIEKKQMKAEE